MRNVIRLNAGDLTRKIALERDDVTFESGAEKRGAPTVYARPWSKPEALSGRELARAQEIDPRINWRFTLRYRTDVKTSDRVIFASRRMEVRAVLPDEDRREWVAVYCEAKA